MFGLFNRGSKPPNYIVWQNNAARWSGIWRSVAGRTGDGRLLFIVHFDETLAMLHELLEQEGLVAETLSRAYQPSDLCKLPPGIYVARPAALQKQSDHKNTTTHTPLKIIAIEPHLMPEPDPRLQSIFAQIRGDVLYEHHASLDDLTVSLFAGQRTLELLAKAGFQEDKPLQSKMVSNAFVHAQAKIAAIEGIDQNAQSLEQWQTQLPDADS